MIKPTELRLGNWIKKYESGWDFKQVTESDIAELEATPPHAEDMRFQPILLTPEVLESAGFIGRAEGELILKHTRAAFY